MKKLFLFGFLFFLAAAQADSPSSVLLFSHDIHGEMVPCGCNRFPLGGIPQIAGLLNHYRQKYTQVMYVDLGDTFFSLPKLFPENSGSKKHNALKLSQFMGEMGPILYVPGDNDFAAGLDFFKALTGAKQWQLFVSNLKKEQKELKSERFLEVKLAHGRRLFLIALLAPELLEAEASPLFEDPLVVLAEGVEWFKKRVDPKENDLLMLLSHSGMARDREYAQKFPELQWIIGSHTQEFLEKAAVEGKTKIVQAKAQNHYLGQMIIPLQGEIEYSLVKVSEDWSKKITPNAYVKKVAGHLEQMRTLEQKEQRGQKVQVKLPEMAGGKSAEKVRTFNQCRECHVAQENFWQKTPHSIAYLGLFSKKAEFNQDCVGCHSLDKERLSQFTPAYHQELQKMFEKLKKPVRDLAREEILQVSLEWRKLDKKHKLTHNYANVQCLNCHDQVPQHPGSVANSPTDKVLRRNNIKGRCLSCHTAEQTSSWYAKDGQIIDTYFDQAYASVSCPGL